ncbi:hypothetical protein GE09DRAFT_1052157 [Coniochaeta sp. 2T2.1]|nr:hypothetical protein GE09DRAFT_1052157 [Coniochaeta sp. 2T2.1]
MEAGAAKQRLHQHLVDTAAPLSDESLVLERLPRLTFTCGVALLTNRPGNRWSPKRSLMNCNTPHPAVLGRKWRREEADDDVAQELADIDDIDDEKLFETCAVELLACRIVGTLYGSLPREILSAVETNLTSGDHGAPIWKPFAQAAIQPFFEATTSSLVTAMKYACICRTQNRLIEGQDYQGDPDDILSPVELRQQAQEQWKTAQGNDDDPKWNRFFSEIEKLACDDGGAASLRYSECPYGMRMRTCRMSSVPSQLDERYESMCGTSITSGPLAQIPPRSAQELKSLLKWGVMREDLQFRMVREKLQVGTPQDSPLSVRSHSVADDASPLLGEDDLPPSDNNQPQQEDQRQQGDQVEGEQPKKRRKRAAPGAAPTRSSGGREVHRPHRRPRRVQEGLAPGRPLHTVKDTWEGRRRHSKKLNRQSWRRSVLPGRPKASERQAAEAVHFHR